ncbi:hypothetical protein [Leptospira haakeii]|uniref:Uncharacterized protein n=1 Tax=Leptospira haakeii TaxID=2023198 RepID=A0ABX4PQA4_9LEPT|nr:hypothetical protein [Leptospira haakeii]PKA16513.1 hypothetical protein CH363_06975 [Leptospira haakeii]PKA20534.1 hypothetical protein CH377_06380 [Leptospira haakeii]
MDSLHKNALLVELNRTLANLSSDLKTQEEYLKSIGTFPLLDELALEYEDIYYKVVNGEFSFYLTENELKILEEIDAELNLISNKDYEICENLSSEYYNHWDKVRSLAMAALNMLGTK